jgi:aryl-alcohol dehydrogenase-like predicted oxidoreductase
LSEEIVGEAIRGMDRSKIEILTKFGLRWDTTLGEFFFSSTDNNGNPISMHKYASKKAVIKECEACLKRLGTDYIDLFQIHWPDRTTPVSETMEALDQLMKQGKIRAAGVCNYSADDMKEAEKTIRLASNQVPYSMIYRDIEKEIVPYAIKNNKAIIVYSPLQRGLLAGKTKPGQRFTLGDTRKGNPYYSDENIKRVNNFLQRILPLAESKNSTIGQLVIRWTLQQPGVTIALVGARNREQAIENAAAAEIMLTSSELQFINNELEKLELVL